MFVDSPFDTSSPELVSKEGIRLPLFTHLNNTPLMPFKDRGSLGSPSVDPSTHTHPPPNPQLDGGHGVGKASHPHPSIAAVEEGS